MGPGNNAGTSQILPEGRGNTLLGVSQSVVQLELRKYLDPRLSVETNLGLSVNNLTEKANVPVQLGVGYDISKNLSLNATTGQRDDSQYETKLTLGFHTELPDLISPKKGDKTPANFQRLDIYPIGRGKLHLLWETDKVTKGTVRMINEEGKVEQEVSEKRDFDYYHEIDVEKLKGDSEYSVRILIKDPNGNETLSAPKKVSIPPY
jgi:hypothetical protein